MSLQQLALDYDAFTHARPSDPSTSHDAAMHAKRFATTHAERIHAELVKRGPMTAHEIATYLDLTAVQVDRRMVDLEKALRATRKEERRTTPSGRSAMVWAAA